MFDRRSIRDMKTGVFFYLRFLELYRISQLKICQRIFLVLFLELTCKLTDHFGLCGDWGPPPYLP